MTRVHLSFQRKRLHGFNQEVINLLKQEAFSTHFIDLFGTIMWVMFTYMAMNNYQVL